MKETRVYTYNGGLSDGEKFRDVHETPDIILFDYSGLNKSEIIKLFQLESAEIKTSGVYDVTTGGAAEAPDYSIHKIYIKTLLKQHSKIKKL